MIDKFGAITAADAFSNATNASGAAAAKTPAGSDFGSILTNFFTDTVDTLHAGEKAATAGLTGKAPLQEVVDKVLAAEQSLQAALAVRDKIVSAYLEVSRLNI